MTPPSTAHAVVTPEGAMAAVPPTPDAAAIELLERLVIASHRANAAAQHGDADTLHALLDARAEMITALEEIAKIVTPQIGPYRARRERSEAARAALIAKSSELQQINVRLMHCVRAEASRLSVSIAALDRGETTEVAYRVPQAERASNLDLMR